MSTITEYFQQSELALAAYANLTVGVPDTKSLSNAGLSDTQAVEFAKNYSVVATCSDVTGLSATIFADDAGNKYLAVRGTEGLTDYLTDIVDITLLGTSAFQLQYASLKSQVSGSEMAGYRRSILLLHRHRPFFGKTRVRSCINASLPLFFIPLCRDHSDLNYPAASTPKIGVRSRKLGSGLALTHRFHYSLYHYVATTQT